MLGIGEMAQWLSACCAIMGTEFLSQHPCDQQRLVILPPREQVVSASLHTCPGAYTCTGIHTCPGLCTCTYVFIHPHRHSYRHIYTQAYTYK